MALKFETSFLDTYLDNHRLEPLPKRVYEKLLRLEEKLRENINNNLTNATFEDVLKEHGFQIVDLVERVSKHVKTWKSQNLNTTFALVISVGTEVYQIVEQMSDMLVTDDMNPEEQKEVKIAFGQELVYFIWSVVDPLRNAFKGFPLKKTLEKKMVMWLGGISIRAAMDFFSANKGVTPFSAEIRKHPENLYKALP